MWFVYKSIFAERRYMSYSIKRRTSDDIIVKEFWRNNERFADLFNAVLFKGKCVIKAENLQEIDTDVSGTIRVQEYKETLKRARDVVKKYYNGVEFNILGLEMQEKVHLAMPLRTMVYDALGYIKEYNEFKSNNTKNSIKKKRKVYTDDKDKANNKTNTEYKSANKAESYRTSEDRDSGVQEGRLEGRREGRLEGKREGIIEGQLKGQEEARLDSIKTIMRKLNQTVDEAMDTLDIEEKDRAKYRELINS